MITCTCSGLEMEATSVQYIDECAELRVWMKCKRCGAGIVIAFKTNTESEFHIIKV